MNMSENIGKITAALAKAQGEIANPAKESENPHFKSRYADLASGLNAVNNALSKYGIAVTQITYMADDILMLRTMLSHEEEFIYSEYPVLRFPAKHQDAGSAMTYARRYSLFALVGIAGDDDDGNEASKSETPAPKRKAAPPPPPNAPEIPSSAEVMELLADGDRIARDGVVALQKWWQSLSNGERKALGDKQKDEWKHIAELVEQGIAA
jgi:hypothetical protein